MKEKQSLEVTEQEGSKSSCQHNMRERAVIKVPGSNGWATAARQLASRQRLTGEQPCDEATCGASEHPAASINTEG
jgi:hypothetical protein